MCIWKSVLFAFCFMMPRDYWKNVNRKIAFQDFPISKIWNRFFWDRRLSSACKIIQKSKKGLWWMLDISFKLIIYLIKLLKWTKITKLTAYFSRKIFITSTHKLYLKYLILQAELLKVEKTPFKNFLITIIFSSKYKLTKI